MSDNVNKPRHYISESGIEALDVIDAFKPCPEYKAGFFWGNVVKYILRFHKKRVGKKFNGRRNFCTDVCI